MIEIYETLKILLVWLDEEPYSAKLFKVLQSTEEDLWRKYETFRAFHEARSFRESRKALAKNPYKISGVWYEIFQISEKTVGSIESFQGFLFSLGIFVRT